ncbi:hypothetical protein ZWY2020_025752 [Hordeum vulgare]|nr:hypothetical protein ZWY2020_025752 [Hordeum vulgare]
MYIPLGLINIYTSPHFATSPSSVLSPEPPSWSPSSFEHLIEGGNDENWLGGGDEQWVRMALELLPLVPSATGADATDVWSTCGRALHLAATNGRTNVYRYLVWDLGIPVDTLSDERETPLLLAATFGHTATAAWLLERGASARAPDVDGETPLHWTAYNGDRDLAMVFLYKGADVGAVNPRGTALHVSSMRGFPEVVRVLLHHGADPNKVASRVFTPWVSSLLGGSVQCMKLLIEAGANVHAGAFSGATTLLLACSHRGNVGFVKCLLKAGADPNLPDKVLPIEIAAVQAEKKLVQIFFLVTRCPPNMLGWSVAGIMSYVKSAAYKERVTKDSCKRKAELKLEGNKAYTVKDNDTAILMYNLPLRNCQGDAFRFLECHHCVVAFSSQVELSVQSHYLCNCIHRLTELRRTRSRGKTMEVCGRAAVRKSSQISPKTSVYIGGREEEAASKPKGLAEIGGGGVLLQSYLE